MKTIFVSIIMITLSLTMIGCLNQESADLIDFSEVEELNYQENIEIDEYLDERSIALQVYISEIKDTHEALQTLRQEIRILAEELKDIKNYYESENITIDDESKAIIIQSLRSVRLNRYMLGETLGEGYELLRDLKLNKANYSQEQAKSTLINVYQTLNARQQLYENIYESLEIIKSNLPIN